MPDSIRVLVADDHPLFRQGVVQVLSAEPDLTVIGEAGSGEEALRLAIAELPDLVVIDLGMPGGGGLVAIREIARACPAIQILVLTVSEDPADLMDALASGARGYVLKGASALGLVYAVRIVAGGDAYVSAALAGAMLYDMTHHDADDPMDQLTTREQEMLELLAEGLTNREIGERLCIAEKTVKHYMTNVLQKLQVRTRLQAALLAQKRQQTRRPPA